jgi:hypothetical protein
MMAYLGRLMVRAEECREETIKPLLLTIFSAEELPKDFLDTRLTIQGKRQSIIG